jgi:signal transduction histidine kinase
MSQSYFSGPSNAADPLLHTGERQTGDLLPDHSEGTNRRITRETPAAAPGEVPPQARYDLPDDADAPDTPATILYIEDDPASRKLVERALQHAGYRVLTAERGLEGIDIARREVPNLVLTDINLPDLNGREVTTILRQDARFQHTPIVALTAQAMREHRDIAMVAGLTGYLTKPLDIEALPRQMAFYLKGGRDIVDRSSLSQAQTRYTAEVVARLEAQIRTLEKRNAELRQVDQMKDAFIQITAHELRTPLTLVVGYCRLIDESPSMRQFMQHDEGARLLVEGMLGSVERMQRIVAEILTISRLMSSNLDIVFAIVDLGDQIARVIESFRPALRERRITVSLDRAAFPNYVECDRDLLELAFRNLISNAIKYTPDGGRIDIDAQRVMGSAEIELLRISIRDTGIGIAAEHLHRIFENFYTVGDPLLHSTSKTSYRGGGIGLGLAVTKGIIEAHRGRIWAESPGYDPHLHPGSTFHIVIPISHGQFARRP